MVGDEYEVRHLVGMREPDAMDATARAVEDPERLAVLGRRVILDTPVEAAFDRLSRLATRVLRAPIALVSLVAEDRQVFKGCIELPEPWASLRETPLTHSFCQHVVATGQPLVIYDAREDPRVRESLVIPDLGVVAYAGIPLTTPEGHTIGTFCLIDTKPRAWRDDELATLEDLAASVMTEIEARALAQRLEQQAREKDQAVAMIGHDLRTPLAVVVGLAELLLADDYSPGERAAYLATIVEEGHRLAGLLDDVFDLQLLQSGRQPIRPEPAEPRALLERAARAAGPDPHRPVALEVEAGLPAVAADPRRIQQVLGNLLANAVKYSPAGGAVTLVARRAEGGVEFAVRDRGLGIPAESLGRVFEPFERVDAPDRAGIAGTGLGLAICREIVTAHGGRIRAESAGPGRGSTILFTLPPARTCYGDAAPAGRR